MESELKSIKEYKAAINNQSSSKPIAVAFEKKEKAEFDLRKAIIEKTILIYSLILVAAFLIFILQGFKVFGFSLDPSFLKWLGMATIGTIGGLMATIFSYLFKKNDLLIEFVRDMTTYRSLNVVSEETYKDIIKSINTKIVR